MVVLGTGAGVSTLAAPAAAYPSAAVTLVGHGYGHGRGMGQWGAFGYAYGGWTWQQIVGHYYSGAAPAPLSPQQEGLPTSVVLTENDGNPVSVTSSSGFAVAGTHFAGGQGVEMVPVGNNGWNLFSGIGCGGWAPTPFATSYPRPTAVPDTNSNLGDADSATVALQLCQASGNVFVRGNLEAVYNSSGAPRTVNRRKAAFPRRVHSGLHFILVFQRPTG